MFSRLSLLRSKHLHLQSQVVTVTKSFRCKSAATAEVGQAAAKTESTSNVPIGKSLLAAAAGIITVSTTANAVEVGTAGSVPPYDPSSQRFDQSQFSGRFSRMLLQCDPRLLLYTEEEVRRAKDMIDNYKDYPNMDRALWESRRMCETAMNDKDEILPRPFRMSGFVPCNGPICVAMIASQSTVPLLFWSWINQSQNALVNYYNRNSASTMTNQTFAMSYAAAVGSALAVAFGLATFVQKRYPADKAKALLKFVAFPSAVVASSLNCYIVRSPEIDSGIPLQNAAGQDVLPGATSQVAAAAGVHSTTATRALLQAPVYFLPPLLLSTVPVIRRYLTKAPAMSVPVTTYLLLCSFGIGLPATVAIFPQISEVSATDVEERFQHLRDPATNKPYDVFYYDKGL